MLSPVVRFSGHLVTKTLNLDSNPDLTVLGNKPDFMISSPRADLRFNAEENTSGWTLWNQQGNLYFDKQMRPRLKSVVNQAKELWQTEPFSCLHSRQCSWNWVCDLKSHKKIYCLYHICCWCVFTQLTHEECCTNYTNLNSYISQM